MEYYFTLQDLIEALGDRYTKDIEIPNLLVSPYLITQLELNDQQYFFEFHWNIRQQRCYLSIFTIVDGSRVYFIKNRMLLNRMVVSKYINNTDWSGRLKFESVSDDMNDDYTIKDIQEKFVLRYYVGR